MNKFSFKVYGLLLSFLLAGLVLFYLSALFPKITETFYVQALYKSIIPFYSRFMGAIPFSIAEICLIVFVFLIFKFLKQLIGSRTFANFLAQVKLAFFVIALVYLIFIFIWGMNYNRSTFAEIAGLDIETVTSEELSLVAEDLIIKLNYLRQQVPENEDGVMQITGNLKDFFHRADGGYSVAGELYPELKGQYGQPKKILMSEIMSYLGLGGFYFPFTAEANINVNLPPPMLPFITAHEMAHQRGFAREDEANYIAYLTTNLHPDADYRYSGNLMALIYVLRALNNEDVEKAQSIQQQFTPPVQKDLQAINQYWDKYDTYLDNISSKINNLYLKMNFEEDGVASYGRMIDLLLADFRQKDPHSN